MGWFPLIFETDSESRCKNGAEACTQMEQTMGEMIKRVHTLVVVGVFERRVEFENVTTYRRDRDLAAMLTFSAAQKVVAQSFFEKNRGGRERGNLSTFVGRGVSRGIFHFPKILNDSTAMINKAKEMNLGIILDADGTFLLQHNLDILEGYSNAVAHLFLGNAQSDPFAQIVTPNITEFLRLAAALSIDMHVSLS